MLIDARQKFIMLFCNKFSKYLLHPFIPQILSKMCPGHFIVLYPIAFIKGGVVGDFFTIIELAFFYCVLIGFSGF